MTPWKMLRASHPKAYLKLSQGKYSALSQDESRERHSALSPVRSTRIKANYDRSTATFDAPALLREMADSDGDACVNGARAPNLRSMLDLKLKPNRCCNFLLSSL